MSRNRIFNFKNKNIYYFVVTNVVESKFPAFILGYSGEIRYLNFNLFACNLFSLIMIDVFIWSYLCLGRHHDVPMYEKDQWNTMNMYVRLIRNLGHGKYESIMCIMSMKHDFFYLFIYYAGDHAYCMSYNHRVQTTILFVFLSFFWFSVWAFASSWSDLRGTLKILRESFIDKYYASNSTRKK